MASAALLLLAVSLVSPAAVEPEGSSSTRPVFVPGAAHVQALKQEATGIYVLGTTRIRSWSAVHYVLVRSGRSVQIQTKSSGAWLPKAQGSQGGHTIGTERFEQLLSIAGGPNRNVRQLPAAQRDRVLCVAGFGGCVAQQSEARDADKAIIRRTQLSDAVAFASRLFGTTANAAAANTQPYFANREPGSEFRFEFDPGTRQLWFDGWGIHAGWRVPPLDEI
jgi:hypothetical protein